MKNARFRRAFCYALSVFLPAGGDKACTCKDGNDTEDRDAHGTGRRRRGYGRHVGFGGINGSRLGGVNGSGLGGINGSGLGGINGLAGTEYVGIHAILHWLAAVKQNALGRTSATPSSVKPKKPMKVL